MLPELDIGVGVPGKLWQETERSSVRLDRENGTGGKIDAHADDIRGGYPRFFQNTGNGVGKHVEIILGMLKGPVHPQPCPVREGFVHYTVGIIEYAVRQLLPRGHIHQDRPSRQGSEIYADGILGHDIYLQ